MRNRATKSLTALLPAPSADSVRGLAMAWCSSQPGPAYSGRLMVMHRSRLSTLLIDVSSDRASDAAAFWSAALGVPGSPVPGEEQFISLPGAFPGLVTAMQDAASHAHPRTTMRYNRARASLDRHATYVVAAYVPVAAR